MNARQSMLMAAMLEAVVKTLLAIAFAALGAWALLHFLEPCAGASLCMGAVVLPTRTNPLARLWCTLRCWVHAWRVADLEATLARIDDDIDTLPLMRLQVARALGEARVELINAELGVRAP